MEVNPELNYLRNLLCEQIEAFSKVYRRITGCVPLPQNTYGENAAEIIGCYEDLVKCYHAERARRSIVQCAFGAVLTLLLLALYLFGSDWNLYSQIGSFGFAVYAIILFVLK